MNAHVSFEVFAPKSVPAAFSLSRAMSDLAKFEPLFTSVTCGTGGGSAQQTMDTIAALQAQNIGPVVAHMTCTGRRLESLKLRAEHYQRSGVQGVVALRGDGAASGPDVPALIATLREVGVGATYVAAYPEVHPKASSLAADLEALKAKQDAGAQAAITQFFFDPAVFLRFRDAAVAAGINIPLIPGILPVRNWTRTSQIAAKCNTVVPADIAEGFARAEREGRSDLMAIAQATELCDILMGEEVGHLHFYTLNQARVVSEVCCALGLTPAPALKQVA